MKMLTWKWRENSGVFAATIDIYLLGEPVFVCGRYSPRYLGYDPKKGEYMYEGCDDQSREDLRKRDINKKDVRTTLRHVLKHRIQEATLRGLAGVS